MKEIVPVLDGNGIWVYDRGNDSKSFFRELLQIHKVRFIARLRSNRFVVNMKTGEYLAVEHLPSGVYQVLLLNRYNTKIDWGIGVLTLVIEQHLDEKQPIRLLTNLACDHYGTKHIVRMYLDRWGIENMFKRAKERFSLEKVRVLRYQRLVNLVALVQFAMNVSSSLYLAIQKQTTGLIVAVLLLYRQYMKKYHVGFNVHSFISFMQVSLKPLQRHTPRPPPVHKSLFSEKTLQSLL